MIVNPKSKRRSGTTLVEFAIVASVLFLLTIGTMVVCKGVFHYQCVASVARIGARWASVHGGMYHAEEGRPLPTAKDVYTNAILPQIAGLDPSQLTYTVTWKDPGQMPTYKDVSGNTQTNTVTVTITYSWVPELYVAPVTLSSTSVATMQY